ncbi:MAG: hypothetical protein ACOY94_09705 [Bacillota bacterium]
MTLGKVQGVIPWGEEPDSGRLNADDPMVVVYEDGRMLFKHYAARLLALTAAYDPEIVKRVQEAAAARNVGPEGTWSKLDAEAVLKAGGTMPAPTHAQVAPHPVQPLLLVRAARQGDKGIRTLSYPARSARPSLAALRYLKQVGIKVPSGTRLELPVKLMEDEEGRLMVAVLFDRSVSRTLDEVDRESTGA